MTALTDLTQAECREYIDLYTTYQGRAERAEAEVQRLRNVLAHLGKHAMDAYDREYAAEAIKR